MFFRNLLNKFKYIFGLNKPKITIEEFIKYLVDILIYPDEFIIDEYSNSEFYKYNKLYFNYDSLNDTLWCSNENVWLIFKEKYGLNYQEIEDLLKEMLFNVFNMNKTVIRIIRL